MISVGDKVKVIKTINPFTKQFYKKVGYVTEIREVPPSKSVPKGIVYMVKFRMYNKRTKKIGRYQSFPDYCLFRLDTSEKHAINVLNEDEGNE